MRKILIGIIAGTAFACTAQKFADLGKEETSVVTFFSKSPIEDIEAVNKKAAFILDAGTGEIQSVITMRAFKFKNGLMEEHFNENYVESVKFPNALFKGKVNEVIDIKGETEQKVTVTGKMTIHGVTNDVTLAGSIIKQGEHLLLKSVFKIKIADYDIKIPSLYVKNIAEEMDVAIAAVLSPFVKK